jgi:hypothetical protein
MTISGLESIDGRMLDGLEFCARAYAAFDAIRNSRGGVEELRMRKTKRAKKIVEEVLPLARYVQMRYGPGLRIKLRWRGGSQRGDAYLTWEGAMVTALRIPSHQLLEVTTAVHPNEYLAREHLNETGHAYAPRSTSRDRNTGKAISEPSVFSDRQLAEELVTQVRSAIQKKRSRQYPRPTSLLIQCVLTAPLLDDEWDYAIRELQKSEECLPFREVVLLASIGDRFSILHSRKHRHHRSNFRMQPTAARCARGGG